MVDIDKMTTGEWLNYRQDLIDAHLAKGLPLIPSPDCGSCDVANDYVCFDCECYQIDKGRENESSR